MDAYIPPCEKNELLLFDFKNLMKYIDFHDNFNISIKKETEGIQSRLNNMENMEKEMKELMIKFTSYRSKIDSLEDTIYHHQQKMLNLESLSKDHIDKIISIEVNLNRNNRKIEEIDGIMSNINEYMGESSTNIQNLLNNVEKLGKMAENHSEKIGKHEESINYLNGDIELMKIFENKITEKFKRQKENVKIKLGEIDSMIESMTKKQEIMFQQTNKKLNSNIIGSVLNQDIDTFSHHNDEKNHGFPDSFIEKTIKSIHNLEDDIKQIKKLMATNNNNTSTPISANNTNNNSKKDKAEPKTISKNNSVINNNNDVLKEVFEKIKGFTDLLTNKLGREELEKSNKSIQIEIEKLNQKILKSVIHVDEKTSLQTTQNSDISKINLKLIQDMILSLQKDNEDSINKIKVDIDNNTAEINKIYESILDLRRQFTEISNDAKIIDLKELPLKLIDIEGNIKNLKITLESFLGGDLLENEGRGAPLTMKEFVANIINTHKNLNDKIEKCVLKVDNFNAEILTKIRKDLMCESNIIMDNFKLDLKSNLSKIEEKVRDKVDKFNIDEILRKFDQKILNEVSRKLELSDLKKNNNVINKKIDNLENKISRTLVDTLIDLQLDEAPLIIKQGMKGEKCASCNQIVNPHYGDNNSDRFNLNNSVKKVFFNEKTKKEDNSLMKSASTIINMNHLPDIPTSNTVINNNIGNTSKVIVTDKNKQSFNMDKLFPNKHKRNFNKTISNSLTTKVNEDETVIKVINEEPEKVIKYDFSLRINNKHTETNDKKIK